MVTLKNGQLAAVLTGLSELLKERMSSTVGLKVRHCIRDVTPLSEDVEQERQKVLREYAKKDEQGEFVSDSRGQATFESAEDAKKFVAALNELLMGDVTVEHVLTAKDLEGIQCTGETLMNLGNLLED